MEVSTEAKRIMVVALGKLYSSRTQRGGLRLHRSLLLSLVMKSARDIYHAAQTTESMEEELEEQQPSEVKMTTEVSGSQELQGSVPHPAADVNAQSDALNQEDSCPSGPPHHTRKRRGNATAEPDFLPCKKAKLEYGTAQQLIVNSVLVDYANCSSELGHSPSPIPLQTVIAAC